MKKFIPMTLTTILLTVVMVLLFAPTLSVHKLGLVMVLVISTFIGACVNATVEESPFYFWIPGGITIAVIVLLILSTPLFTAKHLSSLSTYETVDFAETISESDTISDIALMDTETAKMFGERTLGELSELVSTYDVDERYTTICLDGKPMKIAPLKYDNIFKYWGNSSLGIPGYVLVDPVNNTSKYVAVEKPIRYSPSAGWFVYNLRRHLWRYNPTNLYGKSFFEIDEEGKCYWITPIVKTESGLYGGYVVTDVVITDAVTGANTQYALGDVPEWVDIVIDGDTVCKYYDWYGKYKDGFLNACFAQTGCVETTDDFGYKVIGEDVYIYTGVTSCNSSSSAIGFILVNSRTGEGKFMSVTGAEEHSAMQAAEGEVSDYGWVASFPSIINVNGEPAYLMVLKDTNNIVKRYAMVNIKSYNIVAIDASQKGVLAKYNALMNGEDAESVESLVVEDVEIPENLSEKDIEVSDVKYIVTNGNTTVYVTDVQGNVYKMPFEEGWLFIQAGDTIHISYQTGDIGRIYSFTN